MKYTVNEENLFIQLSSEDEIKSPSELSSFLHPSQLEKLDSITSPKRRSEYIKTRTLLRSEFPNSWILPDDTGKPIFPSSHSGSISHKDGLIGLGLLDLKNQSKYSSLGIDIERFQISENLRPRIAPHENIEQLSRDSGLSNHQICG